MVKNKIKKRPDFTQIPEGFSKIFRILPSKKKEGKFIEKEIMSAEFIDKDGRKKQISVIYLGLQHDAYALLLFLILLAKLNVNKNNIDKKGGLEILEATDECNADIVKKLEYAIEPTNEKCDLTKLLKVETNFKELIFWLELTYRNDNIRKVEKILEKLQLSSIKIVVKDMESHSTKKVYSNLFLYQNIVYDNRNQNKISIVFNPLAYLVLFSDFDFKSTINLNIVMELSKRNINKVVLFYVISDNLKFKSEINFHLEDLFSLWTEPAKSRQTKSFRRKFILETLREIEELSKGSFKFIIDEHDKITATRTPDRSKVKHET
jgi:hypothetical protein